MPKRKPAVNPFYVLLVIVGVVFFVTACAYGVMAFKAVAPGGSPAASDSGQAMLEFLARYGGRLMIAEIVLLAITCIAATGTDRYWDRRRSGEQQS